MRELKPVELTALCSVSIVETIAEIVGLPARIKWPNDVMIGGRKVCGILTEVASRGGGAYAAVVGIGLNVNLDPAASGLPSTATSLSLETGQPVPREMIFSHLIGLLDARLRWDDATLEPWLRSRWESLLWRRRQRVTVAQDGRTLFGVVEGLAESGALLLRGDDGSTIEIVAGDVAPG
jgi:BirA family biotin operon repressor/biotin-[acetyl-CoA-carboxylase] ligase